MLTAKHLTDWGVTLYTSATNLSASGNSGVQAMPAAFQRFSYFPMFFEIVGNGLATDETLALTLQFFTDAAGAKVTTGAPIGTITFTTLTASVNYAFELWPGDISGLTNWAACPPWFQANWTLAGTTKSMGFTLYGSFWHLDA